VKGAHVAAGLALLGAGFLFYCANQSAGGSNVPGEQDSGRRMRDHLAQLGFPGAQVHLAPSGPGNVLLPHRYPTGIGDNITNMIATGFQGLMIPHQGEFDWYGSPPSQAVM
jgi:hypothetical protein